MLVAVSPVNLVSLLFFLTVLLLQTLVQSPQALNVTTIMKNDLVSLITDPFFISLLRSIRGGA